MSSGLPNEAGTPRWPGLIEAYRHLLPVGSQMPVVTLLEGNTPLVPSRALGKRLGRRLWFKVEGANPTGSFKDRGMTLAVSRAVEARSPGVVCASTGNTAASAAAYAARAGLRCVVIVPAEGVAVGKLVQALAHGATMVPVEGTFDRARELAEEAAGRLGLTIVNSTNPDRVDGQQTVAWEICDRLGQAPDLIALPVGNAGNITAVWQGLLAYRKQGTLHDLPRLLGVQAAGAAPFIEGRPIAAPRTVASAIRVGNPASWQPAVLAVESSKGSFHRVSDEEILGAQQLLAREEGLFVEPASAAPVASLLRLAAEQALPPGDVVVAILTGHGLKDVETALGRLRMPDPVPATFEAVAAVVNSVDAG